MRVIPSKMVVMAPQRCAVAPTIGPMSGHRFIDTGLDLFASPNVPQRVYVSEPAVAEMAKLLGWTAPADVAATEAEVSRLRGELEQAQERARELEERFGAIDVLASAGFVARKKPGRPVKEVAA